MRFLIRIPAAIFVCCLLVYLGVSQGEAGSTVDQSVKDPSVFSSWNDDFPGKRHHITIADLPSPNATRSPSNSPKIVKRKPDVMPRVPDGFVVRIFTEGLHNPRLMQTAPNGDLFVSETAAGRIRVLRPGSNGELEKNEVFASNLEAPFGLAFYPLGPDPKWIYVAETNRVVRFPYKNGDMQASRAPEIVVAELAPTAGGHSTRTLAFSKDGEQMFVSVGSASNNAEGMGVLKGAALENWEKTHALGAAWDYEEYRADVLSFRPDGTAKRIFATGLRNCVGLAVHPETGTLYCATNERDGLGDNLVPDYMTRVSDGAFFGWPWAYMGGHEDPSWKGARSDLLAKITNPDVLIQPHSAPLTMTFYTGNAFPAHYRGSVFVALHGSWNRTQRTGYKVVRVLMNAGVPTGEYEDFLTGFVLDDARVFGRPVGVTVGQDGALYVSEDGNGTIYRITYEK